MHTIRRSSIMNIFFIMKGSIRHILRFSGGIWRFLKISIVRYCGVLKAAPRKIGS